MLPISSLFIYRFKKLVARANKRIQTQTTLILPFCCQPSLSFRHKYVCHPIELRTNGSVVILGGCIEIPTRCTFRSTLPKAVHVGAARILLPERVNNVRFWKSTRCRGDHHLLLLLLLPMIGIRDEIIHRSKHLRSLVSRQHCIAK